MSGSQNVVEQQLTAYDGAVVHCRQLRKRHLRTGICAAIGYWVTHLSAIGLACASLLLFLFSANSIPVKAVPAGGAIVLAAFSQVVPWRRLTKARLGAVRDMDREYSRFSEKQMAYAGLNADERIARFWREIERIDDEAMKVGWLDPPSRTQRWNL